MIAGQEWISRPWRELNKRCKSLVSAHSDSRALGSTPTWAKVVALGQAEPLHQPELLSRLPANFSTLALLARCSEQELQEALAEGLVTPKLS